MLRRLLQASAGVGAAILFVSIAAVAGSSSAGACSGAATGSVGGAPAGLLPLYRAAAARYGLGPHGAAVLAAINAVETDFGHNLSASSAGAVGWMQFEPGTWARYGVTPAGSPAPDGPLGWNDPGDAIYSAAGYLRASGAPGDWPGAVFTYNHAQWYVDQVLSLAQTLYDKGAARGGDNAAVTWATTDCVTAGTGGYVNPLAHIEHLVPERIDMGVDYSGRGTIVAIGAGRITAIHSSGWPNGTFIEERLSNGRFAGKDWYYAEDITPTVRVNETVAPGQPLGEMFDGGSGIETGWSVGDGATTLAARLAETPARGEPGGWSSAAGASASRLLRALGAPGGVMHAGGPHGPLPAGYP